MDKVLYDVSFAKVDAAHRIVSGFATLNNLDKQKDIVEAEGSMRAFQKFRGNVRELHSKIAAGKLIDYGISKYYDKVANKVYDGVFVRAYISKGAQDTWEKVLDGTLNGFSVGGEILDSEDMITDDGQVVRVIKEYELHELSLVDNPANPLANVTSIEKAHTFFTDMASETQDKELSKMADDTTDVVEEVVEPVAEVEPVEAEPVAVEEESPKAEQADDTQSKKPEEPDHGSVVSEADSAVLTAAINEIKALLEGSGQSTKSAFDALTSELGELRNSLSGANATVDTVKEELAAVKAAFGDFQKTIDEVQNRVQSVEKDTAVRKSGDLGGVVQDEDRMDKSFWGGRFLTANR